jgi:hypothetical protein
MVRMRAAGKGNSDLTQDWQLSSRITRCKMAEKLPVISPSAGGWYERALATLSAGNARFILRTAGSRQFVCSD